MPRLVCLSSVIFLLVLLGLEPSLEAPTKQSVKCVCPTTNEECQCRLKGMKSLPVDVLNNCSSTWKKVDFSFNSIETLNPPGLFSNYTCRYVETLSLFVNAINGTLSTNTFNGLGNLRHLNLSRNSISTLKGKPFYACPRLQSLDLSLNSIRVLSTTTFEGLGELEFLQLFGNYIGFVAANAFTPLKRLKRLVLAQNNMTQLRAVSFNGLTSLERLDLVRNPIKDFEMGVFDNMPNLRELVIGLCGKLIQLTTLKGSLFTNLTKLTHFNLTTCTVRKLHKDAFVGLTGLQVMSLHKNALRKIERAVWKPLKSLRVLDLSGNYIDCLYDFSFSDLESLENLNLANNDISYLSDATFRGLENLETLTLTHNPLRFVQIDAFCRLTRLRFLHLRDIEVGMIITSDDKNSSLTMAVEALPATVRIEPPKDTTLQGRGTGCRAPPGVGGAPSPQCHRIPFRKPNSRQYLLIIIGVCVSFLLMAMAIILSYRAWSKRKRTACEKAEQAALEEEKQEMMEKPSAAAQANGGSATTELLAAGQSAENGVVLHHPGAQKPGAQQSEAGGKAEENTMTHLAVV